MKPINDRVVVKPAPAEEKTGAISEREAFGS